MNEADTRAKLIDPQLKAAGWDEVEESRIQREYPINKGEIRAGGVRAGQLKADYILIYKNIKLAVIEAKSEELEVGEGVSQAKLYGEKLHLDFAFAANGKSIYQISLQDGKEDGIEKFADIAPIIKSFGASVIAIYKNKYFFIMSILPTKLSTFHFTN